MRDNDSLILESLYSSILLNENLDGEYMRLAQNPEENKEELQDIVDIAARESGRLVVIRTANYGLNVKFSDTFKSNYKKTIEDACRQTSKTGKLLKIINVGKINEILHPDLIAILPEISYDVELFLTTNVNGEYFTGGGTGKTKEGKNIIVMAPCQADFEYVKIIIHEIKHIQDKSVNKHVDPTGNMYPRIDGKWKSGDYSTYRKLPSERRAESFVNSVFKKLAKITDPVVYDKQGNIIPLSQRFKTT